MSLQDSFTLGRCFGKQKSTSALKDFEQARIPQTSQEVNSPTAQLQWPCIKHADVAAVNLNMCCVACGVYELQGLVLQVLFSRYVGELRQGRWIDPASFDWPAKPDSTKALLLNAKRSEPDYRASALAELKHHTNNLTANGHSISVQ